MPVAVDSFNAKGDDYKVNFFLRVFLCLVVKMPVAVDIFNANGDDYKRRTHSELREHILSLLLYAVADTLDNKRRTHSKLREHILT